MPTNDERRKLAARLRNIIGYTSLDILETIQEACGCNAGLAWEDVMELKNRLADLIEPEPERTCMDVNEAWSDFGANVFSDDALDDFDKFEKVYQICQEIVEPLEFTCWIERTEQDEFGFYDYLSCGHIAMRQWPEKTRYCPSCGAKVIDHER